MTLRTLAAAAAALVLVPAAQGADVAVIAVPGAESFPRAGAIGLVVPDAGPTTSEARALASLERGEVVNSLRGRAPTGDRLVEVEIDRMDGSGWTGYAPLPGTFVVVGIPSGGEQPNDRRYPIVVSGWSGVLTSDSTRIPGLVSIADVATERLRAVPRDDPVSYLRRLDERIRENGDARLPAALLAAGLIALLALVSGRAAVAAFAAVLAANLALGATATSNLAGVLVVIGVAAAVGGPLLSTPGNGPVLGLVLASVIGAYLAVLAAEPTWVALSPLGPSQNARFFGLSNLLETMLLVPALAAAATLGAAGFAAVAVLSLVAVAGGSFGADGGGAIVLAAGFAVLAATLLGRRALALAAAAGAALVGALLAIDALAGPSTHVSRSVEGGPIGVLGDLGDRVALSSARFTDDWATALIVSLAVLVLAVLVAQRPRRPLPLAFAAAIAVSLVVNDSPLEVSVGGVVGYLALARARLPESLQLPFPAR
jgi:hypothetical protein